MMYIINERKKMEKSEVGVKARDNNAGREEEGGFLIFCRQGLSLGGDVT